jgi:septum formation protein
VPAPPRLILASTSVYRRQLLERLKAPFEVANPGIAEPHHPGESPPARSARLAAEKAQAVARSHPGALVIGSDQVAVCRGQVLDKPGNEAGSWAHLRLLSGAVAEFYTAVALVGPDPGTRVAFSDLTRVHFRNLSEAEIRRYVSAEKPYDCAGAFRAESLGISLFERIESEDPSGLVGLPLIALSKALRAAGFELP